MLKTYDYVLVGSGLFSAVFAHEAIKQGKTCFVVEKKSHIGGNIYCEEIEGISVHQYGAHIFHTSNQKVWDFVNQFVKFNRFINSPMACYKGKYYNLPFNMNTFYTLWGTKTPQEAKEKIESQRKKAKKEPKNLEEQAIYLVGQDIYEILIKGYTEKQWGRSCKDLPSFIIKRLPVRYTFDNNYFEDTYQGIPTQGYNHLIQELLKGCDIECNVNYLEKRTTYNEMGKKILYTGMIDEFYNYCFGALEYRSLSFETEVLDMQNFQGNAVINYTEKEVPYTRIIEHKHFDFGKQDKTVITREYPAVWEKGLEPYYPINNEKNQKLYQDYARLAEQEKRILFGGRLAEYKYYDMDKVIESALALAQKELHE
ncbi:UDP-galactopyranose mutase [Clostridia bacterium]|nr:UDP-galactopyranose mutase [Clostridia bacterium]